MTLAYQVELPTDRLAMPVPARNAGRDRRVHHRREAIKVWAQVDGGWYRVHDLSLGGLGLERPVDRPGIGTRLEGEIHSRACSRNWKTSFSATVVRLDDGDSRVGVAFAPMEPEQIDGLLAILSAVEREYVMSREAELRSEALHRLLRQLGYGVLIAAGTVAAGYAAWLMR